MTPAGKTIKKRINIADGRVISPPKRVDVGPVHVHAARIERFSNGEKMLLLVSVPREGRLMDVGIPRDRIAFLGVMHGSVGRYDIPVRLSLPMAR